MAGIFDYMSIIIGGLFAAGLVGVMVYERARIKQAENDTKESSPE